MLCAGGARVNAPGGSVGSVDLCHQRTGSGPPLLLLHGIGLTAIVWRPVLPLLAREREVIALDLPGFGASPPGPETIDGLAHAVAAFAAQLGLERPHVAGSSLGGAVALALGADGHARSVCALSPVGFGAGRSAYTRTLLRASRLGSRALAPVADALCVPAAGRAVLFSYTAARPARIPPADAADTVRAFARAPAFDRVLDRAHEWSAREPACPTTIAWAQRDAVLPRTTHARRARRALPGARHLVLRGCGHVPMWDDPEQVAQVLLESSA
jgi:pimeloyl-ACP methyl ester carboxylesterase